MHAEAGAAALVELGYDPREMYYDEAQELLREARQAKKGAQQEGA